MSENLDIDWENLLKNTPPEYDNPESDKIAQILHAQNNGEDVDDMKLKMIINNKWINLVKNTPPEYGNPDSDKIAKILKDKDNGKDVDDMILNMITISEITRSDITSSE